MKNTKDFYNKTASQWADKWYDDDSMIPYLKEFFALLPKNPSILDLCCGAGYESMRMKKLGARVVGIDFSEKSIEIARSKNPDIPFYIDNMLNDYSHVGIFNGCVVIAGLVHLSNDKLETAFNQIHKSLDEHGLLLVGVKHGEGKNAKSSYTTIDGEDYDRDFYGHTLEELKTYSKGMFTFLREVKFSEDTFWKYYIFRKKLKKT